MNTDIKLMITLAGNQRLPLLEADIFADFELTWFYLNALSKGGCEEWYPKIPSTFDCEWAAYYYARDVIKGRWPEAEGILLKNKYIAKLYFPI